MGMIILNKNDVQHGELCYTYIGYKLGLDNTDTHRHSVWGATDFELEYDLFIIWIKIIVLIVG